MGFGESGSASVGFAVEYRVFDRERTTAGSERAGRGTLERAKRVRGDEGF
jgi:hypothetical protein